MNLGDLVDFYKTEQTNEVVKTYPEKIDEENSLSAEEDIDEEKQFLLQRGRGGSGFSGPRGRGGGRGFRGRGRGRGRGYRNNYNSSSSNADLFIPPHIQMKVQQKLETPEQILQFREERRSRYPTKQNVQKKLEERQQRIERGELLDLPNINIPTQIPPRRHDYPNRGRRYSDVPSHRSEGPSHIKSEVPSHIKSEGPSHIKSEVPSHIKSDGPSQIQSEGPSQIKSEGPPQIYTEISSEDNIPVSLPIPDQSEIMEETAPMETSSHFSSYRQKPYDPNYHSFRGKRRGTFSKDMTRGYKKKPRREVVLREKLMEESIRNERIALLQSIRYIVTNNFFLKTNV